MSDQQTHLNRANDALSVAKALRGPHPAWALVPLFYSALHLMHAKFDADQLPKERRHPKAHKSYRDQYGELVWGNLNVVRRDYPPAISKAYGELFDASVKVRYGNPYPVQACPRYWATYERLLADTWGGTLS